MERKKAARAAFGDGKKSRDVHVTKPEVKEKGHKTVSAAELDHHLATAGYAFSRGLVITLVFVLVFAKLQLPVSALARLSLSVFVAYGLFTTCLEYLAKRSLREVESFERKRETWEFENFPEGEVAEMLDLYEAKGYSREQAQRVVDVLVQNKAAFVDIMMVEELGILPSPNGSLIFFHCVATYFPTLVGGIFPIALLYLLPGTASVLKLSDFNTYMTLGASWIVLFFCGVLMARATISSHAVYAVANVVFSGIACAIAYAMV